MCKTENNSIYQYNFENNVVVLKRHVYKCEHAFSNQSVGVDIKLWPTLANTLWVQSFGNRYLSSATEQRKNPATFAQARFLSFIARGVTSRGWGQGTGGGGWGHERGPNW